MIKVAHREANVLGVDGVNRSVTLDNPAQLDDAFRSAAISFAPSLLKIGFGWDGDAMIDVAAAFVKGKYFQPGQWELCGEPLGFSDTNVGSGVLKRCTPDELIDDIDCGVMYYLWGLPRDADGIVFALNLTPGQKAQTLADIGEDEEKGNIHLCIDSDNCQLDKDGKPIFVPVMHMSCNTAGIDAQTAVVAGLFVGSGLRYGLFPGGIDDGPHYVRNEDSSGTRAGQLEPRALRVTPAMTRPAEKLPDGTQADREGILQHLGLMP